MRNLELFNNSDCYDKRKPVYLYRKKLVTRAHHEVMVRIGVFSSRRFLVTTTAPFSTQVLPEFFVMNLEPDAQKTYKYLTENYSYLTVIGGSYGFFHSKKWTLISFAVYIIMYSVMTVSESALLITSYLLKDNLALWSQAFHIFIIGLVVSSASITLTLRRAECNKCLAFMMNPQCLSKYTEFDYLNILELETIRKKNFLLAGWLFGYGLCAGVVFINPFINSLGDELLLPNDTGVYWKDVPFALWWPLDAHNTNIGWATLLACEVVFAFFSAIMCIAATVLCFTVLEKIMNQLKLLRYSIEHLDERSTSLFNERYPRQTPSRFQDEYDACYYECIQQNVEHFHNILFIFEKFQNLADKPIAVPFFGGALLLGLAGINILSDDDPRIGPKVLLFFLALTEGFNLYLLCHYGESLQARAADTEEVFDSLFYTRWYYRSMKCRRAVVIFRYATTKPLKISAAKLIVMEMETFSNLVNSAYSIFNLRSITSEN